MHIEVAENTPTEILDDFQEKYSEVLMDGIYLMLPHFAPWFDDEVNEITAVNIFPNSVNINIEISDGDDTREKVISAEWMMSQLREHYYEVYKKLGDIVDQLLICIEPYRV